MKCSSESESFNGRVSSAVDGPGVRGHRYAVLRPHVLNSLLVLEHINKTHWKSMSSSPGSEEQCAAGTSTAVN